jgi:hypothetical protein
MLFYSLVALVGWQVDMAAAVQVVRNRQLVHGAGTFSPSDTASWEKKQLGDKDEDKDEEKEEEKEKGAEEDSAAPSKEKETVTTAEKEKEKAASSPPQIHYYPALPMAVVPIAAGETQTQGETAPLAVGTLVQCELVANWFQQRLPLYARNVTAVSAEASTASSSAADTEESGRVKGTIVRLKINTTLGFDVSEIALNEQYRKPRDSAVGVDRGLFSGSGGSGEDINYYCDSRELRGDSGGGDSSGGRGGGRERGAGAHVGDIVEFTPLPLCSIAACVSKVRVV